MKILGLIIEANPLHNGHAYFIKKAIEEIKPNYTICVISTNFTSRGEISVINKFDKTKYLLNLGIDLVLEAPFTSYNCSADYFAHNMINILYKFKVTDIAFGVELDNVDKLNELVFLSNKSSFNNNIKKYLDKGFSYSTACNKSLLEETTDIELIENYSMPNNTLAIQYIKVINEINNSKSNSINYHLIKRINNNYYDTEATGTISSATSLRQLLCEGKDITPYLPFEENLIDLTKAKENLLLLLKYKALHSDFKYLGIKEGFENRLKAELVKAITFDELIKNCETKRYKVNYIKRTILNILLEIDSNFNQKNYYLRILGFTSKGNRLIKTLNEETKKDILLSPKKELSNLCQIEISSTKLYGIITGNYDLYLEEYKLPIKK